MTRVRIAQVLLAFALVAKAARADDEKAARELLKESAALKKKGDLAGALAAAEKADQAAPSAVTGLAVAELDASLGKLLAATLAFKRVVALELGASAPQAQRRAQETAAKELDQLSARVPTIKVDVQPFTLKDVHVTIDGEDADPAVARYVDPGEHAIAVTASGWQPGDAKITVGEGDRKTVTISLKKEDLAATFVPAKVVNALEVPPEKPHKTAKTIAFVVLGGAAVSVGVGAYFGLKAMSKNSDLASHCSGKFCDAEGLDLDAQAHSAATVSTIGFGVGAGLAIVGGWLLVAPPDAWELSRVRIGPSVGPKHAGLAAGGKF